MEKLHEEAKNAGNGYRKTALEELNALLKRREQEADDARKTFFRADLSSPSAYARSVEPLREAYLRQLGWPLLPGETAPDEPVKEIFVGEDDFGKIYRCVVPTLAGLHTYGMLFVPKGDGPKPLVICQHGGMGTPERIAGFFGSANYNDMLRRVQARGAICFAPQLYLWEEESFGPGVKRDVLDGRLKMMGGSAAALEVRMIMSCLDAMLKRPDVDPNRVGMIGLSYGGFYTMLTAAADPRIRVACSSCAFTDMKTHAICDWSWKDSAMCFNFPEICKLVCPRALFVENGTKDTLFDIRVSEPLAPEVADTYKAVGLERSFRYSAFEGEHELSKESDIIDFLFEHL